MGDQKTSCQYNILTFLSTKVEIIGVLSKYGFILPLTLSFTSIQIYFGYCEI